MVARWEKCKGFRADAKQRAKEREMAMEKSDMEMERDGGKETRGECEKHRIEQHQSSSFHPRGVLQLQNTLDTLAA